MSAGSREDDEDASVVPSASPAAVTTGAFGSACVRLPFLGYTARALRHSFLASMRFASIGRVISVCRRTGIGCLGAPFKINCKIRATSHQQG